MTPNPKNFLGTCAGFGAAMLAGLEAPPPGLQAPLPALQAPPTLKSSHLRVVRLALAGRGHAHCAGDRAGSYTHTQTHNIRGVGKLRPAELEQLLFHFFQCFQSHFN